MKPDPHHRLPYDPEVTARCWCKTDEVGVRRSKLRDGLTESCGRVDCSQEDWDASERRRLARKVGVTEDGR